MNNCRHAVSQIYILLTKVIPYHIHISLDHMTAATPPVPPALSPHLHMSVIRSVNYEHSLKHQHHIQSYTGICIYSNRHLNLHKYNRPAHTTLTVLSQILYTANLWGGKFCGFRGNDYLQEYLCNNMLKYPDCQLTMHYRAALTDLPKNILGWVEHLWKPWKLPTRKICHIQYVSVLPTVCFTRAFYIIMKQLHILYCIKLQSVLYKPRFC